MREASGSGSATGSRDDGVATVRPPNTDRGSILVGTRDRDPTGDTCGFYKLEKGQSCRKPRSCYDCLNVAIVQEPHGCVLTPSGICQRIDAYNPARDFRNNNATVVSMAYINYFPSANTSYCEPNDAACSRCRDVAEHDIMAQGSVRDTETVVVGPAEPLRRYCRGEGGCVCLAVCETSKWTYTAQDDCSGNSGYAFGSDDKYRSALPVFMALQVVLIVVFVYRQRHYTNRFRRRGVAEGPYNNVEAISSPSNRLQLTGWRALQEQQIQREKAQKGLISLMSPRGIEDQTHIIVEDELPSPGSERSPRNRPRRCSTDQSVAMLESDRGSDVDVDITTRHHRYTSIDEEGVPPSSRA
ncbi:hypothetical protein ATCC90586_003319 [Pythium insidiosum]|nr:hypothetical protein ATCC90586_003319 [Pythium insidiosum]